MKYIKSPLNYTGGKHQILSNIFGVIGNKEYRVFVDLFGGGFNVGINSNAERIIYNDQIQYLIEMFKCFKENEVSTTIDEINSRIRDFELTKQNKDGYIKLRNQYNRTKNIYDLFVLTCFSFNHQIRFNSKHEFNTPFGQDRSSYNESIESNLLSFIYALKTKNIEFVTTDFNDFQFDMLCQEDIVYCDPPYLITTGSYNDGKRGFKDWTLKEENELLNILDQLHSRGIKFALSNVLYHRGNSNDVLIEWSKKYFVHYIEKDYNNCNYQIKDRDNISVEVIITNIEGNKNHGKSEQLSIL